MASESDMMKLITQAQAILETVLDGLIDANANDVNYRLAIDHYSGANAISAVRRERDYCDDSKCYLQNLACNKL